MNPLPQFSSNYLYLRGYDTTNHNFLLHSTINQNDTQSDDHNISEINQMLIEREYGLFQHWDRLYCRGSSTLSRISNRRFKKLTQFSWRKYDFNAGWDIYLHKNVKSCEVWINQVFQILPEFEKQLFLNEQLYQQRQHGRTDIQYAKDMQQYLTPQSLINLVLEEVSIVLDTTNILGQKYMIQSSNICWLEPSCGDGRFIRALLNSRVNYVRGIELDPSIYKLAMNNLVQFEQNVKLTCDDFLDTKCDTPNASYSFVVGNPPFGIRKSGDQSIDTVKKFILHSAFEWQACLIAFILPKRCGKDAYVADTLKLLNATENQIQRNALRTKWVLHLVMDLKGHIFEHLNRQNISQPAELHIYIKRML